MKKLIYIIFLSFFLPFFCLGQNDSISLDSRKTQLDIDLQLLGVSLSFKKSINNSPFSYGLKIGAGFIISFPKGSSEYYENIYLQPIINWKFRQVVSVETGPRISAVIDTYGEGSVLTGFSVSLFVKLWKIQIGTRSQASFINRNFSDSRSSILFSQESIIIRISIH